MSRRRTGNGWAVVIAFAAVVAATQMLWLTFAPIDTDVARDFGVSQGAVGWFANVFPLFYVLLSLPAGLALDRWFRRTLVTGALLTAFGGVIRLVHQDYAWAMFGQLCVAVAQPLVLNAVTKVATGYLAEKSRPAGIAAGSGAQFLGSVLALAMGPLLEAKHSLGPLLPIQAILGVAAALALVWVLRRRPPADDGPPAAIGLNELKAVWTIPLTRTLAQIAFVGVGVFVALSTYLQPILNHDHISSTAAGLMLAGMLIAGTVGCGLFPPPVARREGARGFLVFAVCWVTGCCVVLALLHAVVVADFILVAAMGMLLLPALPVMLELIERRMGASGGVATAIVLLAGNAGGLVVAVLVSLVTGVPVIAFLLLAAVILYGIIPARRLALRAGRQHEPDSVVGSDSVGPDEAKATVQVARQGHLTYPGGVCTFPPSGRMAAGGNMSEQIVSARGLRRTYRAPDGTSIRALDDVNLDVYAGELTVIAGPSGSGKSTLLQVLAGLDRPDEGTVQICGEEVTGKGDRKLAKLRRQRLGFVFQSLNLIDSISARDNIALPLRLDGRPVDDERLVSLATTFGIAERLDFLPSQMSGGQQQRVAVARALMASPDVVFADEPTAALDPDSARQIVDVLSYVAHEHGHAVVVISHDPMVASRGDRVFRMTSGKLELISAPGSAPQSPRVEASVGQSV